MIVNAWTVSYLLLSAVSIATGLLAVSAGARIAPRWTATRSGSEARGALERTGYLVSTLVGLGLLLRLAMAPLWFGMLGTLVASVPGAMCAAGVHMVRPGIAWPATVLQILVGGAYAAWLFAHGIDRRDRLQPCAAARFRLLPAIGALLLVTAGLEAATLASIEPVRVGCCRSLFDRPREAVPDLFETSTWLWTALLAVDLAAVFALLGPRLRAVRRRFLLPLAPAGVLLLLLSIHTRLAPDVLAMPTHHCAFCLWKSSWSAVVATAAIVGGLWAAFGLGVVPTPVEPEPAAFERRAARAAFWALLLGVVSFATLEAIARFS